MDRKLAWTSVFVVAVIATIGWATAQDDHETGEAACQLLGIGADRIALGLAEGSSAAEIIAGSTGTLADLACTKMVDSLVQHPATPQKVETGQSEVYVTARDFAFQQVPTQPTCFDWLMPVVRNLCLQGAIGPPTNIP